VSGIDEQGEKLLNLGIREKRDGTMPPSIALNQFCTNGGHIATLLEGKGEDTYNKAGRTQDSARSLDHLSIKGKKEGR